jgi:NAD(P)-dependent dehydrogenase (short-subunit alcohol dehydrogenase family)
MNETFRPDLFAGKVALVSGGTSGIGAAIANAFVALGATVTVTGATAAEVETARAAPEFDARDALAVDVRDMAAIGRAVDALPRLDILVNCAGIIRRGDEHEIGVFEEVIDVNLAGTMRMCVAARPRLAATRGCIVNVASILSYFGGGLVPAYSASKGGVAQLTKSLAIACAREEIRVNAVAPGWIATPLTEALRENAERNQAILARTPMARWGLPAEIADAAVFLCSPAARFMTGTIMIVDGGYSAM